MAKKRAHVEEDEDQIFVEVARTGGTVTKVCLNGDRTVEDALDAAGIDYSAKDRIKVNGESSDLDEELEDGDTVTVAGKISGGNA